MAEIVHYMQTRQYQRANDAYLRLSIGNAPWPIGVTMVGCVLTPSFFPRKLMTYIVSMNGLREKRSQVIKSPMC